MNTFIQILNYFTKEVVYNNKRDIDKNFLTTLILGVYAFLVIIIISPLLREYIYDYLYSFDFLRTVYDLGIAIILLTFIFTVAFIYLITISQNKIFKDMKNKERMLKKTMSTTENKTNLIDESTVILTPEPEVIATDGFSCDEVTKEMEVILKSDLHKVIIILTVFFILFITIILDLINKSGNIVVLFNKYEYFIDKDIITLAVTLCGMMLFIFSGMCLYITYKLVKRLELIDDANEIKNNIS